VSAEASLCHDLEIGKFEFKSRNRLQLAFQARDQSCEITMISNTAVGFILLVYCIVLSHAVDSNADKAVLVDLFTSTGGNATWNVSWPIQSSAVSYCSYGGVTCLTDSGGISRVAAISLEKLNLVGTLPVLNILFFLSQSIVFWLFILNTLSTGFSWQSHIFIYPFHHL
jgi:hypothetical protein